MANAPVEISTRTAATAVADADLFGIYKNTAGLWNKITGAVLRNQMLNRTVSVADIAASGAIGTAAATVDIADVAIFAQTTATVLLSNPTPTNTSVFRTFGHYNGGTVPVWNAYGQFIPPGGSAYQNYIPGVGWKGIGTQCEQTIAFSATAVAYPLDTNANSVTLLTVPAGFPAAGSSFNISLGIDNSSGTSNKTVTCSFGTFNIYSAGSSLASATAMVGVDRNLYLPTTSSQVSLANIAGTFSASIGLLSLSGTHNTASNTDIKATVTKGTGTDVTTLRYYTIKYTHGA